MLIVRKEGLLVFPRSLLRAALVRRLGAHGLIESGVH